MSKVLIKLVYGMNSTDYAYGIHILDNSDWEQWKQLYEKAEQVSVYGFDDNTETSSEQFLNEYITIVNITDEQYETFKKLNLLHFGVDLPSVWDEERHVEQEPKYQDYKIQVVRTFEI